MNVVSLNKDDLSVLKKIVNMYIPGQPLPLTPDGIAVESPNRARIWYQGIKSDEITVDGSMLESFINIAQTNEFAVHPKKIVVASKEGDNVLDIPLMPLMPGDGHVIDLKKFQDAFSEKSEHSFEVSNEEVKYQTRVYKALKGKESHQKTIIEFKLEPGSVTYNTRTVNNMAKSKAVRDSEYSGPSRTIHLEAPFLDYLIEGDYTFYPDDGDFNVIWAVHKTLPIFHSLPTGLS